MAEISDEQDRFVTGLCKDSKEVKEENCFFALKGLVQDGRDYIMEAIEKGACAVVLEETTPPLEAVCVPVIKVPNLAFHLGEIAARFYHHPANSLSMVGVTGTSGKTSVSQFIAMSLKMAGTNCGVMGTLGYGFPNHLSTSTHTTVDAITLQKQLAGLSHQGAQAVVMEVSSHALEQFRTNSIIFDMAIFTNLSRDHLDFHGTMDNYAAAKKKLFYSPGLKQAIINTDDPFGISLAQELKGKLPVYCYGLQANTLSLPMVQAYQVNMNGKGLIAKVQSPWGQGQFRSRLLGRFAVSNLLAVLTALLTMEVPFDTALSYLSNLETIPGRMQAFGGGKLPLVVVDYAHKPDALKQALQSLREYTHGNLWCVLGCGGDRDKGKRPLMGQIAERYCDQLIITDDNPRTEDPAKIVAEIVDGLLCPWAVEIEHDRGTAIAHVISCARAGDVVLVAGKGHEDYQIIGNEKIPFNDSAHIQTQLRLKQKNAQ